MRDYEPYFEMWNSVLYYPNPELPKSQLPKVHGRRGDGGSIPCHHHKTCGALVEAEEVFPPKVCPGCGVDTATEVNRRETPSGISLP